MPRPFAASIAASLVLLATTAAAQEPGGYPPSTTTPAAPQGQGQNPNPGTRPRDPLDPVWQRPTPPPPFRGFPVFPSRLQGLYPTAPGTGAAGGVTPLAPGLFPFGRLGVEPLPADDEPAGWPAWARTRDRAPLPFAPDLALLVRNSDRVWFTTGGDEPFVPLFFHDKLRTLSVGGEVQVRQSGEFELLLHSSTRLQARGPNHVRLVALAEDAVEVECRQLTYLRVQASTRRHRVSLPDGSRLEFQATIEEPMRCDLVLQRADEPAWLGGRATITNFGDNTVDWVHCAGVSKVEPGQQVTFFLQPPTGFVAAPLAATAVSTEKSGEVVLCRAEGAPGNVTWCGARFEVPAGASVRLDPQQGALLPLMAAAPSQDGK